MNQRGRHHFAGRAHTEIPARILAFDEKTAFDIAQLGPHHAHFLLELLAFQLAVLFLDFRMQGGKTVVVGNGRAQAFLAAGLQTPDDIHLLAPFRIVRPGAVEQPGINLHRNARPERVSEHRAQIAGPERPDEIDRLPVRYLAAVVAGQIFGQKGAVRKHVGRRPPVQIGAEMVLLLTDDRLESVSFISYVRIEDRHFPLVTEIDLQTIGHVPAHVSPHSETRIAHIEPILAPVQVDFHLRFDRPVDLRHVRDRRLRLRRSGPLLFRLGRRRSRRQQQQQTSDCFLHILFRFFARLRPGETLRSAVFRDKNIA